MQGCCPLSGVLSARAQVRWYTVDPDRALASTTRQGSAVVLRFATKYTEPCSRPEPARRRFASMKVGPKVPFLGPARCAGGTGMQSQKLGGIPELAALSSFPKGDWTKWLCLGSARSAREAGIVWYKLAVKIDRDDS